jgi:hypothetical protein
LLVFGEKTTPAGVAGVFARLSAILADSAMLKSPLRWINLGVEGVDKLLEAFADE